MGLRNFLGSDGERWNAWIVSAGNVGSIPGTPLEWLAFQNEDGTERRRLFSIPAEWDNLPEERLDLLRRMAEPVKLLTPRHSPPEGVDQERVTLSDNES
jgi:hypothetical protein